MNCFGMFDRVIDCLVGDIEDARNRPQRARESADAGGYLADDSAAESELFVLDAGLAARLVQRNMGQEEPQRPADQQDTADDGRPYRPGRTILRTGETGEHDALFAIIDEMPLRRNSLTKPGDFLAARCSKTVKERSCRRLPDSSLLFLR